MMRVTEWCERLLGRNRGNRLKDAAGNFIRVALGIWTTVFEVTFVAAIDKAVGHTDRCATICQAIAEFVDGLGLVETCEAEMVIRPVNGDMLVFVFIEGCHEILEVFLTTDFTHVLGGEV